MKRLAFSWLLLLAACGGNDSPPAPYVPPPPPPLPQPVSGWAITQWGTNGAAQAAVPLSSPMFTLPTCASASLCWISYVEMGFGSLSGKSSLTLSYVVSGDNPTFVHDSPNNIGPVCGGDPGGTLRLLLHMAGDTGQSYGRWFSKTATPLGLGPVTVTVPLLLDQWQDVNGLNNDPTGFSAVLTSTGSIGIGLGGGCYASHGVAVSSGGAAITVNGYGAD